MATAAYKVEGAWKEHSKGESIWDRFAHTPGTVDNGDTGDVACDHYHRYLEDIELVRAFGLAAYRFWISWPRVLPAGRGSLNAAGVDYPTQARTVKQSAHWYANVIGDNGLRL